MYISWWVCLCMCAWVGGWFVYVCLKNIYTYTHSHTHTKYEYVASVWVQVCMCMYVCIYLDGYVYVCVWHTQTHSHTHVFIYTHRKCQESRLNFLAKHVMNTSALPESVKSRTSSWMKNKCHNSFLNSVTCSIKRFTIVNCLIGWRFLKY